MADRKAFPDQMAFLTTPRAERARRDARERLADRREVYRPGELLPMVGGQAERCMDCGLPFCHSACPLGNLVPEWNRLVAAGDWRAAADRLLATNNFPEFTGRLCPAPCESACVLAIDGAAVAIKNVELAIADRAWEEGWDGPRPAERGGGGRPGGGGRGGDGSGGGGRGGGGRVAVIGSGPAGLAAAQQLTRAGHATTVYERADRPGGLLRYGIPPFRLEKHRLERRLDQLRAEGTTFCTGVWIGRDVAGEELRAGYDALVVAVGATACRELPVAGRELPGVHPAMEYLTWANRVDEGDCPVSPVSAEGRHVVIVGGGDTAADCLGTALRQHAASVTQLDINPRPPERRAPGQPWPVHPKVYRETTSHEESGAVGAGPRLFAAATVAFEPGPDGRLAAVRFAEAEPADRSPRAGTEQRLPAQLVLLALGFTGPEPDQRLFAQLGLATGPEGTLARDDGFATTTEGVFVAGDAGRGQSLIVWAIAEGRAAAAAVDRYLRGSTELPAPIRASSRALTV
ncbi:NAD(P)H-dependent glutamate synthase small subunit [Streptomyces sp. 1114.5]|uniref:glutamate synthase subunit beta n=1 Tax=Streptomyces sp. 1114.5 TaxID=1938830 RepID=UPI000F234764|nr:glutamate synthase subunit beta [Streptomyces sp. 1114.5]RKT19749.1 NAD(P)H-dependent glutamate synthase small subunit [Streptomyces sp. 1114.5]